MNEMSMAQELVNTKLALDAALMTMDQLEKENSILQEFMDIEDIEWTHEEIYNHFKQVYNRVHREIGDYYE